MTKGDLDILHNALSLYWLWLKEKGTLALEHGDIPPEQGWVLDKLKELEITPEQLVIELKASALLHVEHLRDLIEEELKQ